MRKQTRRKSRSVEKIRHQVINPLKTHSVKKLKKVEYCPIIAKMLKNNNRKFKKPILYVLMEFQTLPEKLSMRLVCKDWNEILKKNIQILQQENFMTRNNLSNRYKLLASSHKRLDIFANSDQKFSKKKMLITCLNSKSFQTIKNKTCLRDITNSKNLVYDR
jgi:hypothetical protein